MLKDSIIKCDICGYQFKTKGVMEERYADYQPYDEMVYYPLPEENAHLIKNYICDACYNQFPTKVKEQLIEGCGECLDRIDDELKELEEKYLLEVKSIMAKESTLENVKQILEETKTLLKLPDEVKEYIQKGSPYISGMYYFDKALDWEKEKHLNQRMILDWERSFGLYILKYPEGKSLDNWVTKEEFLDLLLDCKVKDKTAREVVDIINKNK